MPLFRLTLNAPSVNQRCKNQFDFVCSLGNKQVINELVKFIQETLQFIKNDKQTTFLMMGGVAYGKVGFVLGRVA